MSKKKPHPSAIYEQAQIAKATRFSIAFVKGQGERFVEYAPTEDDARVIARRLNTIHGGHGRRACIYAVLDNGRQYPIPNQEVSRDR
jgi:hypothetical protein